MKFILTPPAAPLALQLTTPAPLAFALRAGLPTPAEVANFYAYAIPAGTVEEVLAGTVTATRRWSPAILKDALGSRASLVSPAFTGTPTAPTAGVGTNTTQLATTAFVRGEVAALIAASPAALDTLGELAAALGNDANFATTITNTLAAKASLSGNNTWSGTNTFTSIASGVTVAGSGDTHLRIFPTGTGASATGYLRTRRNTTGSVREHWFGTGADGSADWVVYDATASLTRLAVATTGLTVTGAISAAGQAFTGSQVGSALNVASYWETTGNPALIFGRANNVQSGATAKLLDLGTNAAGSLFAVDKAGGIMGAAGLTVAGNLAGQNLTLMPAAVRPPANNGELTIEATSNILLTFRYKGSDGISRSGSLSLL